MAKEADNSSFHPFDDKAAEKFYLDHFVSRKGLDLCVKCNKICKTADDIKRHIKEVHFGDGLTYQCPKCNYR